MKLLRTIKRQDISSGNLKESVEFRLRKAARAVVLDKKNKIALLNVSNKNYYKLPGGGVLMKESIEKALNRECKEETGCNIRIKQEIGIIKEYINKINLLQVSYCYLVEVEGEKGTPKPTKKELNHGFIVNWVEIDNAIDLVKKSEPTNYEGKFIVVRDLIFLQKAKDLIN